MDISRRSVRLSPHASPNLQRSQTSAPAFGRTSQTSSTTTTSYPSPTDYSGSDPSRLQSAHHFQHTPHLNVETSMSQSHQTAPLPSPSAADIDPFFGRPHAQPTQYQSFHPQQQPQHQQTLSKPTANQSQHHPHHNPLSESNNFNQPGVLPADFLAEAARRAQMACLMRDLGDVSL